MSEPTALTRKEVTITYRKPGKKSESGSIVLLPSIHPDDFEQVVWRAKASLRRQGFTVEEAA